MQKKLIVLALASAFAAPAFAATSNVDIYGQLDVSVDYASGLGGSGASCTTSACFAGNSGKAWRLSSNSSRIGLKGSEDLGGGLAAIWQFEQGVNLDNGATSSAWGNSRNSFLGLKGGFGTVLAGTHDTPYKLSTASLDPFADTAGDYNSIIGSFSGFNTSDLRLGNVLAYISPSFSGLTAAVAMSFVRENGQENGDGSKPSAWTGMVNYANGPLYLAAGYESARHVCASIDPFCPDSSDESVRSWKLGAGYTMGNFTVNAIYDNIKLTSNVHSGTTFIFSDDVKRSAWGLNGVYNMGNIALKAGFYHAGKITDSPDSGANMYEAGVDYNLSKRSKLYAVYQKVRNDTNADYCASGANSVGFGGSGPRAVCSASSGEDPSVFSIGMRHTF